MLVRILNNNNNRNWEIISLTGPIYNQQIATAEGFRLSNARFQHSSITGFLAALHGAEVEDFAYNHTDVIRALGLNGVFNKCHHEAVQDLDNSGWFDAQSREALIDARYINGMNGRVYYSTQEDINLDRKSITLPDAAEDSVLAQFDSWSATDHFKAGFRKLKETLTGG